MGEHNTEEPIESVGERDDLDDEMSVDRLNEAIGSPHVPLAVGTFAALGAALVLAAFMSSAFTSGESAFGQIANVGFAIILAPLIAVLTGTWAARDGSRALTATFGGIAGMFALYVSFIVFRAAILGDMGQTANIGPLIGLAIGTGIAAGMSARLVTAIEDLGGEIDVSLPWQSVAYPASVFVALGVGTVMALFAAGELAADTGTGFPTRETVATVASDPVVTSAPALIVLLAPVLGVMAGLLASTDESGPNQAVATLLGAGAGFLLAYFIGFGMAHVLESAAMEGQSLEYGSLVGMAVGVGIAGGLGAFVGNRLGDGAKVR